MSMNGSPATTDYSGLGLGEALLLIRKQAGLTISEAASREGSPSRRTLSAWEACRELPDLVSIEDYLEALGLGVKDLLAALEEVEERRGGGAGAEHLPRIGFIDAG